ncbi:hypothetical protein [Acidisoma sp. 7E03]
MTALVARPAASGALARTSVAGKDITLSKGLAALCAEAAEGRQFMLVPAIAEHLPEATEKLQAVERMCVPPDAERLRMWGLVVNGLVGAPLEEKEFKDRLNLLLEALQGVPAAVLTRESARAVAETSEFWPSLKSIMAVLRPEARKLELLRHGLRTVLAATALPPPDDENGKPENAEAVQAILDSFRDRWKAATAPARASAMPAGGTGRGTNETPIPRSELNPADRLKALKLAAQSETNLVLRQLLEDRAARLASHLNGTPSHTPETTKGA